MAKVNGVNICEVCKNEYGWEYTISQHLSSTSLFDVEEIDEKRVRPKQTNGHNTSVFEFQCYCPKCDNINRFSHIAQNA